MRTWPRERKRDVRLAHICPHCHRIVPANQMCVCRTRREQPESMRLERQPWRAAYKHPSWRRIRKARYLIARGRCETCGVPLGGSLHPDGALWECDHVIEARRFADPLDANTVENVRVRCVPCHQAKTAAQR